VEDRIDAFLDADGPGQKIVSDQPLQTMNDNPSNEGIVPEVSHDVVGRRLFLQSMGKWSGAAIGAAVAGSWLASAAMGYGIGRGIGSATLQKLARTWFDRLNRSAGKHGFLTVLTLRVFPLAPFTLVNVFVGAWGIRFWDFFSASIVGRIPGIIFLTLAGVQIESFLRQPHVMGIVLLGLTLILVPLALSRVSKRLLSGDRRPRNSVKSSVQS
jgi:membrane protein DedA with SNARE-associated domain